MTDPRVPVDRDACPEFDARLAELAADPYAPPEVEAHLATCDRCRLARDDYREAGRAVAAAFTTLGGPPAAAPARPSRRLRLEPVSLAAAFLLVGVASWLLRTPVDRAPEAAAVAAAEPSGTLAVAARYDAIVSLVGPGTARIEDGTSTFLIRDGRSVVETPIGDLSCDDCEFTVQVRTCAAESMPSDLAALASRCVTVSVSQGRLGTTVLDHALTMGPGQSVTWPMTADCVPVAGGAFTGVHP
ncbi:MAG: hypothetical protein ACF8XB_22820 [Planctomycetota bacterium JB042]